MIQPSSKPLSLCVIGAGYVGLVSGVCFAKLGHNVTIVETNMEKLKLLKNNVSPIFEPNLAEMMQQLPINFVDSIHSLNSRFDAIFIAVGTPDNADGSVNLSFLDDAINSLLTKQLTRLVIIKSTVPVGTNRLYRHRFTELNCDLASNPEFLREGQAINDFLNPNRIVCGINNEESKVIFSQIYRSINTPILFMNPESAELAKYAANAFLATKIGFINQISDMAEKVAADVDQVALAIGLDNRIGSLFLKPGPGFGGSCFPKDTKGLCDIGRKIGTPQTIVESVISANESRKHNMYQRIRDYLKSTTNTLQGRVVAILGLSFKAGTDDMRESPSIPIIQNLQKDGVQIRVYDPEAMENAKAILGVQNIDYKSSAYEACEGAEVLVIVTEWPEFSQLDLQKISRLMNGNVIFDYRNVLNSEDAKKYDLKLLKLGYTISHF